MSARLHTAALLTANDTKRMKGDQRTQHAVCSGSVTGKPKQSYARTAAQPLNSSSNRALHQAFFPLKMSQRITIFAWHEWTLKRSFLSERDLLQTHISRRVVFCLPLLLHLSQFHRLAGHTRTQLCFCFTGHPILPLQILNLVQIPLRQRARGVKRERGTGRRA